MNTQKRMWKMLVLLVIALFLNLPVVTALEISNVHVNVISSTEAEVLWETDQPANSLVNYGTSQQNLNPVGDASNVLDHSVPLSGLFANTTYYYKVQSDGVVDDNAGSLYSFSTLALDNTPPELNVEIPKAVAGNNLEVSGTAEKDATVRAYVNGAQLQSTLAVDGSFTLTAIPLASNVESMVKIEAVDVAGNSASIESKVFADINKPTLQLAPLPEFTGNKKITVSGTISEASSYELFMDNQSVAKGEGTTLKADLSLEEGKNTILIVVTDTAGWVIEQEVSVISDTKAPTLEFDFAKGKEYYQGNAETDISGTTEPGAKVFLYIFRPLSADFTADFDKAWEEVTANEEGAFTFSEVDFEHPPISLKDLAPREVPQGLQDEAIAGVQKAQTAQKFTYHVYLIAEDKSGKTGYAKKQVTVNTCYSSDFDFDVQSMARFQGPLRLNPTLLDEGRESVTAVFNLSYRGSGVSTAGQDAFEVTNVRFEKACTQGMLEDDATKIGCTVFPNTPQLTPNVQKTAWYVTAPLFTTEKFSEKNSDFWDEFGKRQIVFPLKITVSYRENLGGGKMSEPKTQVSCQDLAYFIDIPVDSEDMLPDFIAEEGLDAIEFTIDKIDIVLPYLEKAILVTGVAWIASFIGRLATRYARIVSSKLEVYFSKGKAKEEQCPSDQGKYYFQSEIKHWQELRTSWPNFETRGLRGDWDDLSKSLDTLCPTTTGLWNAEEILDQAYRWTGDRVLCRTVPAGWTASKEKEEVDAVIAAQNQCAASGRGIPLRERENCGELIEKNTNIANPNLKASRLMTKGEFTCYVDNKNILYYANQNSASILDNGGSIVRLQQVHDFGLTIQQAELHAGAGDLIAYRPPSSDQYIIGQDVSCQQACGNSARPGYRAWVEKGVPALDSKGNPAYGCFQETVDADGEIVLVGAGGQAVGETQFRAGYTNDCFVDYDKKALLPGAGANLDQECNVHDDCTGGALCLSGKCAAPPENSLTPKGSSTDGKTTGLLQCVCIKNDQKVATYPGVRIAGKEQNGIDEEWSYHQDRVFVESNKKFGTYYPEWRYYGGRDFSSAFGADYLLDYLNDIKQEPKVSPNTQFLGAYQTMCLSRVRAHLITLRSILEGLRNCIQEAKYTGLQDAGVCKTIFTQQVCGLIYKTISYFVNQCSPFDFNDENKGVLGGVGEVVDASFGSIGEAMQSSIDDVQRDYDNAVLNQYFAGGAQGLTESMCMAAFGYDWPLGADFILDAAYAVPGKTTVHVLPAHRELSTFNPQTGNAVYNYEIGALILPGCRIQSYDVSLKCIGQEDNPNRPGIFCGGDQACDCLYSTQADSALQGDKIHHLDGGRGFDLAQNSFQSIPIPSPQRVDKPFRYDHVVVDLKLAQGFDADTCFDDGYKDGKFYFRINDVSPPGLGLCQIDTLTGKYHCPDIVDLFGGGEGAYLQDPYVSCFNAKTQSWAPCTTPNIFTKGEEIKVRANAVTDGKKYCVKMTSSGLVQQEVQIRQLPEGIPGTFPVDMFLGTVNEGLFKGASTTVVLAGGDKDCSKDLKLSLPSTDIGSATLKFTYQLLGTDTYRIFVPEEVTIVSENGYGASGATLTKDGRQELSSTEIRGATFEYKGARFSNAIGAPSSGGDSCEYRVRPAAGTSFGQNEKSISVTAELYLPDAVGNCYNYDQSQRVKSSAGKNPWAQQITLRLEPLVSVMASKFYQDFVKKNYPGVIGTAEGIVNRKAADIEEVVGFYYLVAAKIAQAEGNKISWKVAFKDDICYLIDLFKTRKAKDGETLPDYSTEVKSSAEYKKVEKYFEEIKTSAQCGVQNA
ncbi:MAG: fibronectin type III domain-containing protein [Nanoarchaeota archaeon]|nr:fibronectin type III domain-containing protein [Nanoarchaeota archaeon]